MRYKVLHCSIIDFVMLYIYCIARNVRYIYAWILYVFEKLFITIILLYIYNYYIMRQWEVNPQNK